MNDWLSCFYNTIWIFAYNLNAMGKNLQKYVKFTSFHEKYTGIAIHIGLIFDFLPFLVDS